MSAPRSRFVTTTDTMRAIFKEMASAGGVPGISSVAVNPVPEDVDATSDRIHAVLADGSLSETAIATQAGKVTVERLKGTATFVSFDIPLAAALFIADVRREIAGPEASVAYEAKAAPAAQSVARRIEQARAAGKAPEPPKALPEARPEGPKARFRETTIAVGLVKSNAGTLEGVSGFVVNPDPRLVDDGEDRLHAILADGSISESCLFCGKDGYAVAAGDAAGDDLPVAAATQAFIAAVRTEALSPRAGMRIH